MGMEQGFQAQLAGSCLSLLNLKMWIQSANCHHRKRPQQVLRTSTRPINLVPLRLVAYRQTNARRCASSIGFRVAPEHTQSCRARCSDNLELMYYCITQIEP